MKLIVGLGNPGIEYDNTRHNIGFKAIDALANNFQVQLNKNKFNGKFYQGKDYILAKPLTYMNLSGIFIFKLMKYFKIPINNLLIIYDETAYETGTLTLKPQGTSNGHNGLKSIINELKTTQFARLKIGIGNNPNIKKSDYVMGHLTAQDIAKIDPLKPIIIEIVNNFLHQDIVSVMNKMHLK